ncbi:hypothetical protein [Nocardia sp. NPDC051570]|uniref:hypothetical protein n=1 Tax=Nocardia sp. NPDC051570 TaxID=3364324 RepID=UPI0037AC44A6
MNHAEPGNRLAEVAKLGNELETLKVLRDEMALRFPELSPGVIPQFSKMFMDLNARIAELAPPKREASDIDDLRDEIEALTGYVEEDDEEDNDGIDSMLRRIHS